MHPIGRCFNGAASFRARKLCLTNRISIASDRLQRGRVLSGAETISTPPGLGLIASASTGPRPFGRGNLHNGRYVCHLSSLLQRGRVLSGAETAHGNDVQELLVVASTGPRPFGRGNPTLRAGGLQFHRRASTGPRPFGRGNSVYPRNSASRT